MSRAKMVAGLGVVLLFYVTIPLLYLVTAGVLDRALGLPPLLPAEINLFLAAICVLVGLFWSSWAYSYLHFVGKGSPAEIFGYAIYPTQNLVTTGPYAYSRDPMVFGMFFILLGITLYANSIAGVAMLPLAWLIAWIYIRRFEEPGLVDRFGEDYVHYRGSVPMFFPSLRPYARAAE